MWRIIGLKEHQGLVGPVAVPLDEDNLPLLTRMRRSGVSDHAASCVTNLNRGSVLSLGRIPDAT